MKYSLFLLEKPLECTKGIDNALRMKCFEYVDTYETLEEAQSAKKDYEENTIILLSY